MIYKFIQSNFKFKIISLILVLCFTLYSPILQSMELDLTVAKDTVGKRFAAKFCEAKDQGHNSEVSSEFALNNTYLKFVTFPDDNKFIEDLWLFTFLQIRECCDENLTSKEERDLKDFFQEEAAIASNRRLYLPD